MNVRIALVRLLQYLRLNRLAHRIYYRYLHGFDTANQDVLPALERALTRSREDGSARRGDYYEFGIFKGYALLHAQRTALSLGLEGMRFFGFDSFQGLPPVEGPDKTARDDFYEGQYACSRDEVEEALSEAGIDWDRTVLIEGFFEDSLTEEVRRRHEMGPVAVALIDCDLYSSTREVLRFVDPLLEHGSVVLFDDWNCFDRDDDRGQRKALREFLDSRDAWRVEPLFSYGLYGQTFSFLREDRSGENLSAGRIE